MFIAEARRLLSPIVGKSGGVLYSSFSTLVPGRFYIIGLNPGGADLTGETIGHSLDNLRRYNHNAYLDEDWSSGTRHYLPGGHPLQRHIVSLMQQLGEDTRHVCASNLIFTRSPNQYAADFPESGHICWPVHQLLLNIVKPDVIIAFGNGAISPYAFLAAKHLETQGTWPAEYMHAAEYRKWQCKAFLGSFDIHDILVIGLPHLSRYTIEGRPAVLNWIKEMIRRHNEGFEGTGDPLAARRSPQP